MEMQRLMQRGSDHPRRCGENRIVCLPKANRFGSPPQVRGKRRLSSLCRGTSRITPAGAGKTLTLRPVRPLRADHPRRCGENREKLGDDAARCGSPPRMRGKHCDEEAVRMRDRITPAYAGKT